MSLNKKNKKTNHKSVCNVEMISSISLKVWMDAYRMERMQDPKQDKKTLNLMVT